MDAKQLKDWINNVPDNHEIHFVQHVFGMAPIKPEGGFSFPDCFYEQNIYTTPPKEVT